MRTFGKALVAGALLAPGLLAQWSGTGTGTGTGSGAYDLPEIESRLISWFREYNELVDEYGAHSGVASSVSHRIVRPGLKRDIRLNGPRVSGPGRAPEVTDATMVTFLEEDLIRDINRRIRREFYRGYQEWLNEGFPPIEYYNYNSQMAHDLFVRWNVNTGYYGIGYTMFGDPIRELMFGVSGGSGGRGDIEDIARRIRGQIDETRRAVGALASYTTDGKVEDVMGRSWGREKVVDRRLNDGGEFDRLSHDAEARLKSLKASIEAFYNQATAQTRRDVDQLIDYTSGDLPYIRYGGEYYAGTGFGGGFTGGTGGGFSYEPWRWRQQTSGTGSGWGSSTGTGNGDYAPYFDRYLDRSRRYYEIGSMRLDPRDHVGIWSVFFDRMVMEAIPDDYRRIVRRRLMDAYFKGATYAKYKLSYDHPSTGWTRDDYFYTWRNGTGNGGRIGGWNGTGTGGTGSGTGGGYYSGYGGHDRWSGTGTGTGGTAGGTGNGRTPMAWDSTGTGGGTSGSGTGGTGSTGGTGGQLPGWNDFPGGGTGGTGGTNSGGTGGTGGSGWNGGSGGTGGTGGSGWNGGSGGTGGTGGSWNGGSGGTGGTGGSWNGGSGGTGGTGSSGGSGGTGTGG